MDTRPHIIRRGARVYLGLQAAALIWGNFVGWTTIIQEAETTNPLTTPCFWGSVVFLGALIWTLYLLAEKNISKINRQIRGLWAVLLGGTLFAFVNNIPLFYSYFSKQEAALSCVAGLVTNPFATSCFLGFVAFLLAFVFACFVRIAGRRARR